MKALLILAAVLVGVWLWRNRRGADATGQSAKGTQPVLQDMVRCRHCGMHIPGSEAIAGQQGSYCSAEHLRLSES